MFIKDEYSQSEQLALMFKAVEAARNGVIITDPSRPDNPIIYTNPSFTEITGYSADEILGRNCRFLQGNDRDQKARTDVREAIATGARVTTSLRNYRKDGTLFYNELTISPVRDDDGRLVAFVGIQNDITSRVEAEARVSDFYSVVSHELRTPIAKIKSSLAVVADGEAGPVSDTVQRFVDISVKAADSLWKLIENILDFKKLESGKFRLLRQRLSLTELIQNTVADFKPVATAASITLDCPGQDTIYVDADGSRLVQVLENLLSNAVKFSPAQSKVTVNVRVSPDGRARVEVVDTGPGIGAADIDRLFGKFQQLGEQDQYLRGGTGLGLAVCHAIVEGHGGSIGVTSTVGSGSTFWFELEQVP